MSLRILFTSYLLLSLFVAIAQDSQNVDPNYRNNITAEVGGVGLFGSLNYEHMLFPAQDLSLRVGIGLYTENRAYVTIPMSIQYFFDLKRDNFIEIGLGAAWADSSRGFVFGNTQTRRIESFWNFFGSIVYRKHFREKYLWKVGFTPLITNDFDETLPWIVLGIGRRF